jgi:hypothetical protein
MTEGRPLLKRIHDLRRADFDAHPVWMNVHGESEQPWHAETDEVTYRPWPGRLPYGCSDPMSSVLVRTAFRLADGTELVGCLTAPYAPNPATRSVKHAQPCLFGPAGGPVSFYFGSSPPKPWLKAEQYKHLGRTAGQAFPIRYAVPPGLLDVPVEGVLDGFYWWDTDAVPRVVRAER